MKLKISKSTRKKVITVELETYGFTCEENVLLDALGEPLVHFEKMYHSTAVSISRRIRLGFKVRVRFDGNVDGVETAAQDYLQFIDEITYALEDVMAKLKDQDSTDLDTEIKYIDINY